MQIGQDIPGKTCIGMYNKRQHMATLKQYRAFPHWETVLSTRCKMSTLHCQMCRFAIRCTDIRFFQAATARLIADMLARFYSSRLIRNTLHNFMYTFFRTSPVTANIVGVNAPMVRNSYWKKVELGIWNRVDTKEFLVD